LRQLETGEIETSAESDNSQINGYRVDTDVTRLALQVQLDARDDLGRQQIQLAAHELHPAADVHRALHRDDQHRTADDGLAAPPLRDARVCRFAQLEPFCDERSEHRQGDEQDQYDSADRRRLEGHRPRIDEAPHKRFPSLPNQRTACEVNKAYEGRSSGELWRTDVLAAGARLRRRKAFLTIVDRPEPPCRMCELSSVKRPADDANLSASALR
jgi:hypothetical protein